MIDMYKIAFEEMTESTLVIDKCRNVICFNKSYSSLKKELEAKGINLESELLKSNFDNADNKTIEFHPSNSYPVELNIRFFKCADNLIFIIKNNSELKNIDKTHMDFISTVSHELRTPLTSIKGFADTLLSAGDKLDKEHQVRFITIIKSQVDRLTRLVENLLTVSKFESKKNENIFKEINVRDFVQTTIDSLKAKYPTYSFHNDVKKYMSVWADSDKFQQVMTNLVDNAAKYSRKGSNVWIDAVENRDFVDILIKDEGVGIPAEYYEKIFTRFSRIDNPLTREVQGTGLGLYITKNLVESMNGKISLQSNSGSKGSLFRVSLPCFNAEIHTKEKFYQE